MGQELTQVLTQLIRTNAALGTTAGNRSSLAQDVLRFTTAGVKPFNPTPVASTAQERPSVLSRIFDIMSRPLYGIANASKQVVSDSMDEDIPNPIDVLREMWEGVSGQDKTTFSDVLGEAGMDKGPGRAFLGLGLDILGDPLTWTGVGLAGKLGKTAKDTSRALQEVEDVAGGISRETIQGVEKFDIAGLMPRSARPPVPVAQPQTVGAPTGRPVTSIDLSTSIPPGKQSIAPGDVTIRERLEELFDSEMVAGDKVKSAMIAKTLRGMEGKGAITPGRTFTQRTKKVLDELQAEEIAAGAAPPIRNLLKATTGRVSQRVIKEEEELANADIISADKILEAAKVSDIALEPRIVASVNKLSSTEAKRTVEIAAKFSKQQGDEIGPKQQKTLFNRVKRNPDRMRLAEEYILQGQKLVDSQGNPARLTDVLIEGGMKSVDDWIKGVPNQAVEVQKARGATAAGTALAPIVQAGTITAVQASRLPVARARAVKDSFGSAVADIQKTAGMSKNDITATKSFMNELFDVNQDAAYTAIQRQARDLMRWVATGNTRSSVIVQMNKGFDKVLGIHNPKILGETITENRAIETIMTRMATWWGAKNIRPYAREYIDTAHINTAQFSRMWQPVFRATTETHRLDSWRVAQGALPASDPAQQQLSDMFQHSMERMFGSSGVKDEFLPGSSVVLRAGITMDEMNDSLRFGNSTLQFTNKKEVIDKFGRKFDFSKDADWLKSWESWGADKDPTEIMYDVMRALQLTTRRNAFIDDAINRWAITTKTPVFNHKVHHHRAGGFYWPRDIAQEMNVTLRRFGTDEFKSARGPLLDTYDKVLRSWKSGVTIYSPSHHIRNIIGDMFLSSMDGVVSAKPYTISMRILHSMRGRYRDILSPDDITDRALIKQAMTRPGDIVLTTKAGQKMTAEQVYVSAYNQGLLTSVNVAEDFVGEAGIVPKIFGGKVQRVAFNVSEARDHMVRLAHFVDVLRKNTNPNLRNAIEIAGQRVKKFHPDGMDLTGMERSVMRRLIPFYSWIRKSTPLIIEGMVMRPHLVLAYPKSMAAIQEAVGIEGVSGIGDPFPADQMFPDWIREGGIGPIVGPPGAGAGPLGFLSNLSRQASYKGEEPGYTVVNPGNPMVDQFRQFSNPKKGILSALTPAFTIPQQMLTGETTLGVPIENDPAWLATQIPPLGIAGRLTGATRAAEGRGEPLSSEAFINWLTAMQIRGTGPYRRQALFELNEELRKATIEASQ